MFNKSNFCHIASNNRNEQKGSVFIYKTSDTLAQVTQSGYFNEKLIDINVHDLIIHVQYDPVARTLKKSVLIVTERTMDNVETAPILDQTIGDDIADLGDQVQGIADLGDQVQGIEEKIPSDASAQNQLATQNDITNKITNCITEIPQDIKLELNNGVLTLKAGAKVYVPNGTNVFNEITTERDLTVSAASTGKTLICANSNGSGLIARVLAKSFSGTTRPLTEPYMLWYDTTNNVINNYGSDSSTPTQTVSLPIAVVTVSNGAISSIDQVFNGFGYIGGTVFALPGVKGLIPNGRNEDGTLNNISITTQKVIVTTKTADGNYDLVLDNNFLSAGINVYFYDKQNNINTWYGNKTLTCYIGSAVMSGGKFVSLTTKTAFHAVDYNDFESTVEDLDNSVVHKTGNETIGGIKTFTGYIKASAGVGVQIEATSHSFNLRSSGATPEGCGLLVDNDASKIVFYATDTKITIGSSDIVPYSVTPPSSDNSTRIATTAWANAKFLPLAPAGMVAAFAGTSVPSGWLKCDGSAVSRTTYAKLFEAIGTRYGTGNGSTTFNLPTQSVLPLGLNADVSVLGTGKTLGFTNGTNNVGLGTYQTQTYFYDNAYNTNITTTFTGSTLRNGAFGVTTDSSKSGLKGTVNLANATGAKAIVCIKY